MSLNFNGNNIGGMQYNGVTIGEAMMDGQIVYRSIIKLTGTSGMTSRNQLRDAVAARGLDYRTVTHLPFKIDTSQATSLLDLFNGWSALVVAPEMTTLQVTDMGGLFRGCTALEYVGDLQTSSVTNAGFMFDACPALTDGNVRLLGRNPNVSTTAMIANSGLTREPWFNTDGTVWRVEQSAEYYYPLDYTTDSYANRGTKTTRLGFWLGSFINKTNHAYVAKATSYIPVTEPWYGAFTMAGWFQKTGSVSVAEYFFSRGNAIRGTAFYLSSDASDQTKFAVRMDDGSNLSAWVYSSTGVIPRSGWFHLAVTLEESSLSNSNNFTRIYVNGVEVRSIHWGSAISLLRFASNDWASAGDTSTDTSRPWEGNIDDIAMWNRTLSASEVWALYMQGRSI